jgi:uncharacterized protein (DUF362 family)/Pyruvate/2-oxoacid:ferredoxin oxidoreductase delta subunit
MTYVVSIAKVKDLLSDDEIKRVISSSIDLIGGLSNIVKKDDIVIVKPNLEAPRDSQTAATTSMVFIESLVELIREIGAKPVIAEGPFMNYDAEAVFKITGVRELCKRMKVDFVNLNNAETIEVRVPGGKTHKKLRIPRIVIEADRIVNVPKLKTHHLTTLTCSMKNMKGVLPGRDKQLSHVRGLHQAIVDISKVVRSDLIVVDGLLAMEGMGPTFGDVVPLGLVIAGTNPVAVDTVCARIMGVSPSDIEHLRIALHDFSIREEDVKTVGLPLEEIKSKFKIPREKWTYSLALRSAHFLDRYIYQTFRPGKRLFPTLSGLFGAHPRIDKERCTACGLCVKSCPVDAIDLYFKRIKASKCIDCLICSELCPLQAVYVKGISQQTPR